MNKFIKYTTTTNENAINNTARYGSSCNCQDPNAPLSPIKNPMIIIKYNYHFTIFKII